VKLVPPLAWLAAWLLAGALYLLLIDITDLPELIVGAAAAVLAASGSELARKQQLGGARIRVRWLRLLRPLARIPSDIAFMCLLAVMQLVRRKPVCGEFHTVRFRGGEGRSLEAGRHALAEALGSFSPNTIVIGVDTERALILAHQLRRTTGRGAVDPLELG
jgi:hypothetical protein